MTRPRFPPPVRTSRQESGWPLETLMKYHLLTCLALLLLAASDRIANAADAAKEPKWLPARAHLVPKETAPEGEGYFSLIEGKNGKLYIGTHANGVNAWLVEFDPSSGKMKVVVDCHKA